MATSNSSDPPWPHSMPCWDAISTIAGLTVGPVWEGGTRSWSSARSVNRSFAGALWFCLHPNNVPSSALTHGLVRTGFARVSPPADVAQLRTRPTQIMRCNVLQPCSFAAAFDDVPDHSLAEPLPQTG